MDDDEPSRIVASTTFVAKLYELVSLGPDDIVGFTEGELISIFIAIYRIRSLTHCFTLFCRRHFV